MNFVCAMRPTVAICSARIDAPFLGIITCWSQPRSAAVFTRSEISARRSRRSSNFAWLTQRNLYERRSGGRAPRTTPPSGLTEPPSDGERGLYSPPWETRTAESKYGDGLARAARAVANQVCSARATTARRRRCAAAFVIGGRTLAASSRSDADG